MDPPPYDFAEKSAPPYAQNPPYPSGPAGPGPFQGQPPAAGFVVPPQYPPTFAQPPQQQTTFVTTSQPIVYPVAGNRVELVSQPRTFVIRPAHVHLAPRSSRHTCPSCNQDIRTKVEYHSGTRTHLIALLLCLFGCWCCVPIPYCCANDCKDAHHHCPNCDAYIGISARN